MKKANTLPMIVNTKAVENNFCKYGLFSLCSATYLTMPLKIPKEVNEVKICIKFRKEPTFAYPPLTRFCVNSL